MLTMTMLFAYKAYGGILSRGMHYCVDKEETILIYNALVLQSPGTIHYQAIEPLAG